MKKPEKKVTDDDVQSKINEIIVEGGTGAGVKMEVDYSETTEKKIPEVFNFPIFMDFV